MKKIVFFFLIGFGSAHAQTHYKVSFKDPVVVSVADKPEKWGFFQFATIGDKQDGSILAKWHMAADAVESYGTTSYGTAVSADQGRTWAVQPDKEATGGFLLPNGDKIAIVTPKPLQPGEISLPKSVGAGLDTYSRNPYVFYRYDDLPDNGKGVYLKRLKKGETEWKEEKAKLIDPNAIRYTFKGMFPVVWWGDIRIAPDGSVIAGIYPGFYIDNKGVADPKSGVLFYRSTDNGYTWKIQGRLPYEPDLKLDPIGKERMGFTEPAFEILQNGTFICVSRTTDGKGSGPMYISSSKDVGKTWTKPKVFAPSGVLPKLLQLKNGVTVLASGRPGVQLRFSKDPNGLKWSDPYEMLKFTGDGQQEQNGHTANISDGYTGLLPLSEDTFLLIYTDFAYKTAAGDIRKAVKVREITVK